MPFATGDDLAIRLGRSLTAPEAAFAEQIIEAVTGHIADAANQDAAWAEALDPVPVLFRELCVAKVISIGANPQGLVSKSEQLGAVEHQAQFSADSGLALTEDERRTVRRTVHGALATAAYIAPT